MFIYLNTSDVLPKSFGSTKSIEEQNNALKILYFLMKTNTYFATIAILKSS